MGKPEEDYHYIIVETYRISGSGLHGDIPSPQLIR
jgi:hypothetical protein